MMSPLLITALAFAPGDLPPPPVEKAPEKPAEPAEPVEPAADPLKEAFKLIEHGKNTVANLEKAVALYDANLPKADQKAKCLGQIDIARAHLRLGDLRKGKKAKLKEFEAGKAAGEKAMKLSKGLSKKIRAEAIAWMTYNMAKVGETNGVMNSLFMIGDLKKNLNKALELDPSNSYARETLGTIYHALPGIVGGSDKKAIEYFEDTVKRAPGFGSTMCLLGDLYVDIGKKDKAREWYEKTLAIKNPTVKSDHWKFDKPCAKRGLKKIAK